ncbi:hypothetical protein DEU56DRAFT_761608 [Suillus clintonianus]|uniref:uncharacterized protein n=1 Tax=Suillus clintonianus TaxID=1904413 RepID=UPI001B864516|nr:uncharacterized protein DEU56DRAFT_761608 [Suillus clintonianus]KAG2116149.1 hypothetical protein DEU56DRAFT_761608 [Suillus clintonianus]
MIKEDFCVPLGWNGLLSITLPGQYFERLISPYAPWYLELATRACTLRLELHVFGHHKWCSRADVLPSGQLAWHTPVATDFPVTSKGPGRRPGKGWEILWNHAEMPMAFIFQEFVMPGDYAISVTDAALYRTPQMEMTSPHPLCLHWSLNIEGWISHREVLVYYEVGLQVPYCCERTTTLPSEHNRTGGAGVNYHRRWHIQKQITPDVIKKYQQWKDQIGLRSA